MKKLVLASNCLGARRVLIQEGYAFEQINPLVDLPRLRNESPRSLLTRCASERLAQVTQQFKLGDKVVVLACARAIVCDGEIFKKPLTQQGFPDPNLARTYLTRYQNRVPRAHVAVVAQNMQTGCRYGNDSETIVNALFFNSNELQEMLDDQATYAADGALPYDINGSCASTVLKRLIVSMRGEASNFIGLPKNLTNLCLQQVGWLPNARLASA